MKEEEQYSLREIPRESSLSRREFMDKYVKPQKPVVLENITRHWPAYQKWDLDYIDKIAGDKVVPLFDNRPISSKYKFNEPHLKMKMSEYLQLLKKGPTGYRIFLYNLLKEVPDLQRDYEFPKIGLKLLKQLPMLFFGGENSKVFMHYDIDLANILHFHFAGEKECILFPPSQTKYLYKVPHALISREDINFSDPDFNRFPALRNAKGFRTQLRHGDALFMPEGYWHQMTYLTPGFSMSLRGLPRSMMNFSRAVYNVAFMRHFDNFMRRQKGQKWIDYKNAQAIKRTHRINHID